ncbi:protein arginine N-methyltransferase 6-like [Ruditapes philippinarum]|uniref:protein arginine N-methyltransferase 6-like n=1 Tax=Ruditapes philippinarum TaxID=129788 RepID=UPI00295C1FC0|nr:protein arginine N-methyltransferase 6-like [Ruditapes philippinarum]
MSIVWIWNMVCFMMDIIAYFMSCFKVGHTDDGENEERKKRQKHDEDYFTSYAGICVHEEMLSDTIRTNAYRYAILKNYESIRGKVVADIGAGTGILSVFCIQAGAKKVYAIEASDIAKQTQAIVDENKMTDRIEVVHNTVEKVIFPEKLDVIVSEWMGYCLFYESMLPCVLQCRDRWLRKDGEMFPSMASLYIAPFTDNDYDNRLDFWSEIQSVYKLSMECMKPYARKSISKQVHVTSISPDSIQAYAEQICHLNLKTATADDLQNVQKDFTFHCFGQSNIHGFTTWFDVGFPESITLTTSPYAEQTHWSQTLFYIDDPCAVIQDTVIKGSISIKPHIDAHRFLDICITYQIGDGPTHYKTYLMNDCIT